MFAKQVHTSSGDCARRALSLGQQSRAPTPRAWHSATVLPDGTVLIVGGIGAGEQVATTADIFDPAANVIVPLGVDGSSGRARHSATLLPDGRVLIVGGVGADGERRYDAELWDLGFGKTGAGAAEAAAGRVAVSNPVPGRLTEARTDQRATLLPDGRVLIESAAAGPEVFDPVEGRFVHGDPVRADSGPPHLAGSDPSDGATGVQETRRFVLHFTKPIRVDTLTGASVSLTGPEGQVEVSAVGAEGGRLVFVTPRLPL